MNIKKTAAAVFFCFLFHFFNIDVVIIYAELIIRFYFTLYGDVCIFCGIAELAFVKEKFISP